MQNTGTYSEAQTGIPIHLIDSLVPFTASSGRCLSMPDAEREDHAAERAALLADLLAPDREMPLLCGQDQLLALDNSLLIYRSHKCVDGFKSRNLDCPRPSYISSGLVSSVGYRNTRSVLTEATTHCTTKASQPAGGTGALHCEC